MIAQVLVAWNPANSHLPRNGIETGCCTVPFSRPTVISTKLLQQGYDDGPPRFCANFSRTRKQVTEPTLNIQPNWHRLAGKHVMCLKLTSSTQSKAVISAPSTTSSKNFVQSFLGTCLQKTKNL